jgi:transcriptional regulator with XRE-family HTH domain
MILGMALNPEPVDIHVGARLKERRILLGLSQERLAAGIGLTFQQLQKYESGFNRVSASRLHQLAHLLGVDAPYFFDGLGSGTAADGGDTDLLTKRETLEFVRGFNRISDEEVRRQVVELIEAIADTF